MKRPSPVPITAVPPKKRKMNNWRKLPNEQLMEMIEFFTAVSLIRLEERPAPTNRFSQLVQRRHDMFVANDNENFWINKEGAGFFFQGDNKTIRSPDEMSDPEEGEWIWLEGLSPVPPGNFGVVYFECTILAKSVWSIVEIGFFNGSLHGASLDSRGTRRKHDRRNNNYSYRNTLAYYPDQLPLTIGCGYDRRAKMVFFILRGERIEVPGVLSENLKPALIIDRPDKYMVRPPPREEFGSDLIKTNFGGDPFVHQFI